MAAELAKPLTMANSKLPANFHKERLLKPKEAEVFISEKSGFLKKDRNSKDGSKIPYIRFGKRIIRYRKEHLKEYLVSLVNLHSGPKQETRGRPKTRETTVRKGRSIKPAGIKYGKKDTSE